LLRFSRNGAAGRDVYVYVYVYDDDHDYACHGAGI
jgi:hypothetical protein